MSDSVTVKLKKETYEALEARAVGFHADVDDVITSLLNEVDALTKLSKTDPHIDALNTHLFDQYAIYKLPKGKILVTENGRKVSNMKKILIGAGNEVGVPIDELNPDHTTYEIGRNLFRHLEQGSFS